ncbi:N/A [soil metagenome]
MDLVDIERDGLRAVADTQPAATVPELRVALFTGNYNYIRDGVALTLNRLVGYLQRQNVPVLVIAPTGPSPAFEPTGEMVSVPSVPIPLRSEYRIALGLPRHARARLEQFRPTLFHIAVPDILGYRALKLAQEWNVPVVSSYHTRYDTYLKYYGLSVLENYGKRYLRDFYAQCRQIYPPSESMAAILREDGIASDIKVWSRGVDEKLFNPGKRSLEWRRSRAVNDDDVLITFVGRLVKEKNTDLLLRVFASLRQRGVRFRAMIVGDGPEMPVMKAGLPDGVFTGFVHSEELACAYASSDIFFFPSESETFGNVTLEAMACGLPAVCADATGSRTLVIEGETGFLGNAKNEVEFVDSLERLVNSPELRGEMGRSALAHAMDYRWDSVMAGLHANYLSVLAETETLARHPA